ncbi:hypothetical protein BB734_21290 [Mycobacterium avium subsp. hominissuis]|nr:hypothetical protein CKJ63_14885 [Mycobacterium avium]PBJ48093.1 hypothetical protein BB734_21290 [Mycobacterium avium subsp. hominissuis]PBA45604.1 hypothetical protein CKJ62_14715 [Mycobacterium avium]PBA50319.1 hypothetical protein CKJ59_15105 [Mycobacterium avium]PBA65992.1 hypothetical protein CKJ55_14230 [Mycobacterium avium]
MGDDRVAVSLVDQHGSQSFHLFGAEQFARLRAVGGRLDYVIPRHELLVPMSLKASPRRLAGQLLET